MDVGEHISPLLGSYFDANDLLPKVIAEKAEAVNSESRRDEGVKAKLIRLPEEEAAPCLARAELRQ